MNKKHDHSRKTVRAAKVKANPPQLDCNSFTHPKYGECTLSPTHNVDEVANQKDLAEWNAEQTRRERDKTALEKVSTKNPKIAGSIYTPKNDQSKVLPTNENAGDYQPLITKPVKWRC